MIEALKKAFPHLDDLQRHRLKQLLEHVMNRARVSTKYVQAIYYSAVHDIVTIAGRYTIVEIGFRAGFGPPRVRYTPEAFEGWMPATEFRFPEYEHVTTPDLVSEFRRHGIG